MNVLIHNIHCILYKYSRLLSPFYTSRQAEFFLLVSSQFFNSYRLQLIFFIVLEHFEFHLFGAFWISSLKISITFWSIWNFICENTRYLLRSLEIFCLVQCILVVIQFHKTSSSKSFFLPFVSVVFVFSSPFSTALNLSWWPWRFLYVFWWWSLHCYQYPFDILAIF